MTNREIMDIISKSVAGVLEKTVFMFPEPVDIGSNMTFDDYEFVMVSLDFSGDKSGQIRMVFPVDFCAELTANLLGMEIDEVDPSDNNFDSAREMLNIISGQLLVNIFGDQATFSLINLDVKRIELEDFYKVIAGSEFVCCMVDDYPVITMFSMQEAVNERTRINSR